MIQSKVFPAKREVLPQILKELSEEIVKYFKDDKWRNRLKVAAEEIIINIIDYSGSEKIIVSCEYLEDEQSLRFEFVDEGALYNPLEQKPQVDIDAEFDERGIGGLGIFLYETIMYKLEYHCEDGKNHLLAYKAVN